MDGRDDKQRLRLLDKAGVGALIGGTPSHVDYLDRTDPSFPRAVKLGTSFNSAKRWAEHEVLGYIRERIAEREQQVARDSARGQALAREMLKRKQRASA